MALDEPAHVCELMDVRVTVRQWDECPRSQRRLPPVAALVADSA
jgi:hypothetical protein